eukprot:SAG11_NODE_731_length_7473_cov_5.500949_1_plen_179_part_00
MRRKSVGIVLQQAVDLSPLPGREHAKLQPRLLVRAGRHATNAHDIMLDDNAQINSAGGVAEQRRDPLRGKKLNLLAYLIFLVVFVNVSFNGHDGASMYIQNNFVEAVLRLRTNPAIYASPVFESVERPTQFWSYLIDSFAHGIHDPDWRGDGADGNSSAMILVTDYRMWQVGRFSPLS